MTQTPGPLAPEISKLFDGEIEAFGCVSVDLLAGQMLKMARALDSLSAPAARPDIGITISPDAEPIGYTGSGSLEALKRGSEGYMWPTPAKSHPLPVYAAPYLPAAKTDERLKVAVECLERIRDDGVEQGTWQANSAADALTRIKAMTDDQ